MNGPERSWRIEQHKGRAGDLHRLSDPQRPQRTVRVFDVERAALVLGSTQRIDIVDVERAEQAGVDVVGRRSGGGAVLLRPGEQVWIDLLVPVGDRLWRDDIVVAARWAGAAWATALDQLGVGPTRVHTGGLVRTDWSDLICFAGMGPGEVTADGQKVVGLSQRRSRTWTRIQTLAYSTWDPMALIDVLRMPASERGLSLVAIDRVQVVPADENVVASVLEALPPD